MKTKIKPHPADSLSSERITEEIVKCSMPKAVGRGEWTEEQRQAWEDEATEHCKYFISQYCKIRDESGSDDAEEGQVIPFELWPDQIEVLRLFVGNRQVVVLKARQLGLTWLAICYALWLMIFKPGITVLIFSLGDREAMKSMDRMKGLYNRLPRWLRCKSTSGDQHLMKLSNESEVRSMPTGTGHSFTAALAIFDEMDQVEPADQQKMMDAIKPTTDSGGQLFLISKANKGNKWQTSKFKEVYRDARSGSSKHWKSVFLPWWARPGRSQEQYDEWKAESFRQAPYTLDWVFSNYPENEEQALAPASGDKRFPSDHLNLCHRSKQPVTGNEQLLSLVPKLAHIPGLMVFSPPKHGRKYVGGADPAEGTRSSNPSALVLVDALTGEEVLHTNTRISPKQAGKTAEEISKVYNNASWLIERNNHGGTMILWMLDNTTVKLLKGPDDKEGWPQNYKNKHLMYDQVAQRFIEGHAIIHSFALYSQLTMVENETLDSPLVNGEDGTTHGDLASAYILALKGADLDKYGSIPPEEFARFRLKPQHLLPFGMNPYHQRPVYGDPVNRKDEQPHNPFGVN